MAGAAADGEISSMEEAKRTAGASSLGLETSPGAFAVVCDGSGAVGSIMQGQRVVLESGATG